MLKILIKGDHDFDLTRGALVAIRSVMFEQWKDASTRNTDPAEIAYYRKGMDEYDVLIAKFDAVLVADTSQDAEEEEDEEEEEED